MQPILRVQANEPSRQRLRLAAGQARIPNRHRASGEALQGVGHCIDHLCIFGLDLVGRINERQTAPRRRRPARLKARVAVPRSDLDQPVAAQGIDQRGSVTAVHLEHAQAVIRPQQLTADPWRAGIHGRSSVRRGSTITAVGRTNQGQIVGERRRRIGCGIDARNALPPLPSLLCKGVIEPVKASAGVGVDDAERLVLEREVPQQR